MKTLTAAEYEELDDQEKEEYTETKFGYVHKSHIGNAVMRFTNTKAKGLLWSATASDDEPDYFGDKCTIELFTNFVSRAQTSKNMGYVSVAHYGKFDRIPETKSQILGHDGTAGAVEELFLSQNRLRAKGHFYDNEVGKQAYRSIFKDHHLKVSPKESVRISIGFYDYKHSHDVEGEVVLFDRNKESTCVHCVAGSPRTFLDGELIHLALTRIPANPRTPIELEEIQRSITMHTRRDDAASIIGDDLADEIEALAQEQPQTLSLVTRSEVQSVTKDEIREILTELLAANTPVHQTDPLDALHDQVLSSRTNEELVANLQAYSVQAKSRLHSANPATQVQEALQAMNSLIGNLSNEIATLKSTAALPVQSNAPRQPAIREIPVPPTSNAGASGSDGKPLSIREQAYRSVAGT